MWWFGLILLVLALVGGALGVFLWGDDRDGSAMSKDQGDFGLRLAVISGLVLLGSLAAFGYAAWQSFFSN